MAGSKDLTRARIFEAARELLEETGLPGFSMRTLGERLGVGAAALRWHVGTRDRLLVDLVDAVLAQVQLPDPDAVEWRDWLRLFAASFRTTLQARPNTAPVVRDLMSCAPGALEIMATCQHVLRQVGYRHAQLVQISNAYIGYIVGYNLLEVSQRAATTSPASDVDLMARVVSIARTHPSPYVQEMISLSGNPALLGAEGLADAGYRVGLEGLIAGLPEPTPQRTASSAVSTGRQTRRSPS